MLSYSVLETYSLTKMRARNLAHSLHPPCVCVWLSLLIFIIFHDKFCRIEEVEKFGLSFVSQVHCGHLDPAPADTFF